MHQFGIDHKDAKPGNILLDYTGIIKFADFRSAKVIAVSNSGSATASNKSVIMIKIQIIIIILIVVLIWWKVVMFQHHQ